MSDDGLVGVSMLVEESAVNMALDSGVQTNISVAVSDRFPRCGRDAGELPPINVSAEPYFQ